MRRRTPPQTCLVTDMEIEKREVLFSVIIVLVMLAVGLGISGAIREHEQSEAEKYTTAVRVEDATQFEYGMKTDFGNALVYGELLALEPVSDPALEGEYLTICKTMERYTMHTRTVTYTDSNGKTKTRTETYWTWDYAGSWEQESKTVSFLGHEFQIEQLSLPGDRTLRLKNGDAYLYEGSHIRYYFSGLPASFNATIHADLRGGDIGEKAEVFMEKTPAEVVDDQLNGQKIPVIAFWVVWLLLTGGAVVGFLYLENRWLDD